ncbi:MAG: PAS domain-containing protein, partial [Bacteroidota bacterium]|nr:PAS domain-containing protein [Bacteroidota bacterium]
VDKDDFVRYFSNGTERIFQRNRAILGRKVQFCHPPSSVHTVEKILSDFKAGRQDKADFWINMKGKFIYISYYAVRDENKEYLGTLEFTQDLTPLRQLEGERRILSYE